MASDRNKEMVQQTKLEQVAKILGYGSITFCPFEEAYIGHMEEGDIIICRNSSQLDRIITTEKTQTKGCK